MRYISFACCLLVLTVALFSGFEGAFTTVQALEPRVELGPEYKNSAFYDRLLEVELTGDHRYDAVNIALSQLGYHEGDSEADMDGLNMDGDRNFVEYTRVWGKVDNHEGNGVSYGYAWCAAFVSWCLRQAGVPKETALTEISCNRMTNWFKYYKWFYSADSGYTPVLGDIIMFADESSPSHVGLVLGVKDGRVYTIEGNSGGDVDTHSYSLTSTYLYGYCVPQYTVKPGMDYASLMERALNPVGTYVVTAKTLSVMSEASSTSELLGSVNKGDKVEVTAFEDKWCRIKYGEGEAWIVNSGVIDEKLMVYTVKYDFKGGKGEQTMQRKLMGDTLTISIKAPTRNGYTFAGWSLTRAAKTVDYAHGAEYSADADATLYAVWTPRELTVTYYNEDGSVFEVIECKYDDWLPKPNSTPTKPDDDEYTYTFAGWDKELDDIVYRNLEYTATFTASPKPEESDDASVEGGASFGVSKVILIGVIGAVAVLAAGAIVVIIIVKKKKNK